MLRVVLFSHTDGAEREWGYIEFTDLLVEHVSDWAYRCHPSGLLTLEQIKGIVAILLWSEVNSGTVGKVPLGEKWRERQLARKQLHQGTPNMPNRLGHRHAFLQDRTTGVKTMPEQEQSDIQHRLEAEMRYRRVFEAAKDGILILNADTGAVEDSNPFMTELLGYSHDQFVGKHLWEIGPVQRHRAKQGCFS